MSIAASTKIGAPKVWWKASGDEVDLLLSNYGNLFDWRRYQRVSTEKYIV